MDEIQNALECLDVLKKDSAEYEHAVLGRVIEDIPSMVLLEKGKIVICRRSKYNPENYIVEIPHSVQRRERQSALFTYGAVVGIHERFICELSKTPDTSGV